MRCRLLSVIGIDYYYMWHICQLTTRASSMNCPVIANELPLCLIETSVYKINDH